VSYPDRWNHPPYVSAPVETDQMKALSESSAHLEKAAESLFGQDQIQLFNKIKGLQHEVETMRQQLLVPPAP